MQPDLHLISKTLKEGGVILHRPDTVWGLSCDATQPEAVAKLSAIKGREPDKSYIILVDSEAMMERHVREVPEVAYDLIEASVSPITIIYPQGVGLADGVCAADGSIAIRVVQDKLSRDILHRLRRPLISSSANISGSPTPSNLGAVSDSITLAVDLVVDRKEAAANTRPSTIIKLSLNGEFSFIRP